MPGLMTAADLIALARDEAQVWDTGDVFDGYPADAGLFPNGTNILRLLNQGLCEYLETGFNKCYFTLPIVAGTREYLSHRGMGRVDSAWLVDDVTGVQHFMEQTTVAELDKIFYQTWRNRTGERPLGWYSIGTRAIGLDVEPTKAWTLKFLADSQVADMALATDIPAQIIDADDNIVLAFDGSAESALPEQCHDGLAYYAAAVICHRKGNHDEGKRLMGIFKGAKELLKTLVSSRVSPERRRLSVKRNQADGLYRRL